MQISVGVDMKEIDDFLDAIDSVKNKQQALRDEAAAIEKEATEVFDQQCKLAESKSNEADALNEQVAFAEIAQNAVIAMREEVARRDELMHSTFRSFAEKAQRDYSVPKQEFAVIADKLGFDIAEKEPEIEEAAA